MVLLQYVYYLSFHLCLLSHETNKFHNIDNFTGSIFHIMLHIQPMLHTTSLHYTALKSISSYQTSMYRMQSRHVKSKLLFIRSHVVYSIMARQFLAWSFNITWVVKCQIYWSLTTFLMICHGHVEWWLWCYSSTDFLSLLINSPTIYKLCNM